MNVLQEVTIVTQMPSVWTSREATLVYVKKVIVAMDKLARVSGVCGQMMHMGGGGGIIRHKQVLNATFLTVIV